MEKPSQHQNHTGCPFITNYYNFHKPNRTPGPADEKFLQAEIIFLSIFQIGIAEAYVFLYQDCKDVAHFQQWLIDKRGIDGYKEAVQKFNNWYYSAPAKNNNPVSKFLNHAQITFWEEFGYLKVTDLVTGQDCDEVVALMCNVLAIDINNPSSWYPGHDQLQGMMLMRYQDEAIVKIRNNEKIRQVFAQLYDNNVLYPNTEKLSYNPPENNHYRFMGSPLHWDMDFNRGPKYYIQGLVYLNDVPEDRGALTLIPGFHHEIDQFFQLHTNPNQAIEILRAEARQIPIAGKKGDLILWLQALPHAASPNHSSLPRFVQYISYNNP